MKVFSREVLASTSITHDVGELRAMAKSLACGRRLEFDHRAHACRGGARGR